MGLSSRQPCDARYSAQPRRRDDLTSARPRRLRWWGAISYGLIWLLFQASAVGADTLRIATFSAPLSRDGPGLLLRDITRGENPQIAAITAIIAAVDPDVLVLTDFDWDHDGRALRAFQGALAGRDVDYPHTFAPMPNSGRASGFDLDQNGYLGDARDAWGYGRFTGDGGIAVLSRLPFDLSGMDVLTNRLWRDVPDAILPRSSDGTPFWPPEVTDALPLSSTAHVILPVQTPDGRLDLMIWAATPPVFDGPEDANGLRARDELRIWEQIITDHPHPFVVTGLSNLDPADGDGDRAAMADFLAHPKLRDPRPASRGGAALVDPAQAGDPAHDTASWSDNPPGNLRVSYVVPSADLMITDAGVFWPAPSDPNADLLGSDGRLAGPHRLVWMDIRLDDTP